MFITSMLKPWEKSAKELVVAASEVTQARQLQGKAPGSVVESESKESSSPGFSAAV